MKYGTCREFNEAFAMALETMGYNYAADYARILPASAHLMWTATGKKPEFFKTISKEIQEKDIGQLQYAFGHGLEGVIYIIDRANK